MAIYQTIIWECETCGRVEVIDNNLDINSEYIVSPVAGSEWAFVEFDSGKRKLVCEFCLKVLTEVE